MSTGDILVDAPRPTTRRGDGTAGGHTGRTVLVWPGVAIVAGGALLVWCSRGLFFVQDEWDFLQARLTNDHASIFFIAHNQHIPVLAVALYKAIYASFGLHHYWPYQVPHVLAQLIALVLLFAVVRRRLGPTAGFFAVLPVVVLGSAWETLLFPFNGTLVYPMVCLLAVLLLLDRSDRRADPAICVLLVLAVSSAEVGAMASLGLLVRFGFTHERRRLWVPLVPLVLYGVWYANYGLHAAHQPGYEITLHPGFLLGVITGSVGGLLGLPLGSQQVAEHAILVLALHVLTVGLLAGLAYGLVRRRRRLTPGLAMILTIIGVWWIALTLTRGYLHFAYVSHYLYVSVILIVLLGAEYFRDHRPLGRLPRRGLIAASCIATALNSVVLVHYSNVVRHNAAVISAEVGALQSADPAHLPPNFHMDADANRAPEVTAGAFAAMVQRLHDTPAPSTAAIQAEPEYARLAADRLLLRASQTGLVPYSRQVRRLVAGSPKPLPLAGSGPTQDASSEPVGACLKVTPAAGARAAFSLAMPPTGLLIMRSRGEIPIRLRLFARGFDGPPLATAVGPEILPTPHDPVATPWHAQLLLNGPAVLCPV